MILFSKNKKIESTFESNSRLISMKDGLSSGFWDQHFSMRTLKRFQKYFRVLLRSKLYHS